MKNVQCIMDSLHCTLYIFHYTFTALRRDANRPSFCKKHFVRQVLVTLS